MQTINLITVEEFESFKKEVIEDIKKFLEPHLRPRQWLRSKEVTKMLNISHGTLQTLRINRSIPWTKIGGIILYNAADINKLLEENLRPANEEFPLRRMRKPM